MAQLADWVAVDWGTSNLRVWGLTLDGEVTFHVASPKGMGKLSASEFGPVLIDILSQNGIDAGARNEVLICGMAGARQGWLEAPYLDAPADLRGLSQGSVAPQIAGSGLSVSILPGVCQKRSGEENVMRGEETQLLGLASLISDFSGVVCMPGTHSKWALLERHKLSSFTTAMTGELHEVLGSHSILRHSLSGNPEGPERDAGFSAGLDIGLEAPELLSSHLFGVRAAALISGKEPAWCAGYLSGLLIGSEVGARSSHINAEVTIPLIGSPKLCALYAEAIHRLGGSSRIIDSAEAVLAGLLAARAH
ncbi:2-keto-3-deoxy-galactonokinase [Devosia pacifica]|uniref:2-keto-3-deoxy-galactonokinase n=1 Tax=Devosia pacifica TaxID=1335967 RepID=A0A918RTT0_9HYPH|nr:2-dehydro-3-deoxygalactonokinase [Devosia pacifica]GHA10750.1 2-keto-3-deoxy-galactonokinase [Devosia pacifica]